MSRYAKREETAMFYVNYRRYEEDGRMWSSTWHKGLKTERGMRAWLARHGFEEIGPGHWRGSSFPYDCDAHIRTWDEVPPSVQRLFAA